jgi:2-oxoglutarate ferredoxin oxidoreductase subunit gamma
LQALLWQNKISVLERELLLTGIGGQGVQLAAQIVARAAIASGFEVQIFGSYGGMMRGGNTEATIVVGDGPIETPPTVTSAWSAILVHPDHAAPTLARVRPDGVVVFNATLFPDPPRSDATGIVVTGSPLDASLVLVGAYSAITGLVGLDAMLGAVATALPPYRQQYVDRCQDALRLGHSLPQAQSASAAETEVSTR